MLLRFFLKNVDVENSILKMTKMKDSFSWEVVLQFTLHLLLLMLQRRQRTLNRPDPHRCRLQRRVSEDLPAHGRPPPNSCRATVRCRACDPIPQGLLHSDHSLNSVHSQSELEGSVSISNLCLLGCSVSGRFLLGILRITNRLSFVSASGGSLIKIGFLVAWFLERSKGAGLRWAEHCRAEQVIGRWWKKNKLSGLG